MDDLCCKHNSGYFIFIEIKVKLMHYFLKNWVSETRKRFHLYFIFLICLMSLAIYFTYAMKEKSKYYQEKLGNTWGQYQDPKSPLQCQEKKH